MSSANFLTVKSHLSELKASTDNLSEASSGTTNSVSSAEELQKFALILGLNVEDIHQDRFRVDRRRLEGMLAENLEESKRAEAFFHRVMNETNTFIKWPTRLKIGARSKKDPHVRVAGRAEDVKLARDKIMQLLDTRSNRVTMKIDVGYTDHSHIIGKGGLTIKRVMEETGCHIHFPDSNRTSAIEKSNQVSIAGDMERVERARARVRALTPLVFMFELPLVPIAQPLPDINSTYVQQIQEQYNVQVMTRSRPKLHANVLVVKGVQWEVQATMEATNLLMSYMCGPMAAQTKVQMSLEISPMHHTPVIGRNGDQLKTIMKGTGTQIMFPDADDPNISPLKKSCVTITGNINDVYNARQQLVGCLPILIMFDVQEEMHRIENEHANRLMQKYSVFINIRRKPKQGITSVVIKGYERCAGDIYEARRELLGGTEPMITAEIPESYNIPALSMQSNITNLGSYNPFSPSNTNMPTLGISPNMANSPCSPLNMPNSYNITFQDLANYANVTPMYVPNPPTPGGYPSPMSPLPLPYNAWLIPSPQPRSNQFAYPNSHGNIPSPNMVMYNNNQGNWNQMTNEGRNGMTSQNKVQTSYPQSEGRNPMQPSTSQQMLNISGQGSSSGYQSTFTGSCVSLDTHNNSGPDMMGSPAMSPINKTLSPAQSSIPDRSQPELASIISELSIADRRAVGCEKKTFETLSKMSPLSDYRTMKAEASKAMQETIGTGFRVPDSRWAGQYFSHTSPGPINLPKVDAMKTPEKGWNPPELVRPNIVETMRSPIVKTPPGIMTSPHDDKNFRCEQLYRMLRNVGLGKYVDVLKTNEVDLSTFASLSDNDLVEIGVNAFGARKKMGLLIRALQMQHANSQADPRFSPPQYDVDSIIKQYKW